MSQREVVKVANLEIPADLIGLLNTVAGTDSEGVGGGVGVSLHILSKSPSFPQASSSEWLTKCT